MGSVEEGTVKNTGLQTIKLVAMDMDYSEVAKYIIMLSGDGYSVKAAKAGNRWSIKAKRKDFARDLRKLSGFE